MPERANKSLLDRFSSFSVILVMVVLMIVGAAMIPLLNVQYTPTTRQRSLSINFYWTNASGKIIEQEVTSKVEGLVAGVRGIQHVSSVSQHGQGRVTVTFKSKEDVDMIRFEIASLMRRLYPSLPEGVSYPSLSVSTQGENQRPELVYTLHAALPNQQILQYAEQNMLRVLSSVPGVNSVELSGATSEYIEVRFSADRMDEYGLSSSDLSSAVSRYSQEHQTVGKTTIVSDDGASDTEMMLLLTTASSSSLEALPIRNVNGRIIRLGDVATVALREALPTFYQRINGLNTINISIYPEKHVNTIRMVEQVKAEMNRLSTSFPESFSVRIVEDNTEYTKAELRKIEFRTVLCVLILLGFVFLVSRNFRYLLLITITLVANILIAFIFYNLFNLELHLYSLAGVTVSLGIVIDTAIIMVDHYGFYRDRRVFISILAALLTTVASLSIVFLLPEDQRANLMDFAAVIIINLIISLAIALLFIPALMDKIHLRQKIERQKIKTKRRVVRATRLYGAMIRFERRHRWAFILLIILVFGIPIHLLPGKYSNNYGEELTRWQLFYNKTFGSDLYQNKLKKPLEIALGGTFRLFSTGIQQSSFYREPARMQLSISAGMPEGCTVQQLNEVMQAMENFLSQFSEIDYFTTTIWEYDNGSMQVYFTEEAEKSSFPFYLKNAVIAKANNFGGANWQVYGVDDQGFSNYIGVSSSGSQIQLTGYNYDRLYGYAQQLVDSLDTNPRISNTGIYGERYGSNRVKNEYYIRFDPEKLALYGLNLTQIYATLNRALTNQRAGRMYTDDGLISINLITDQAETFDLWQLKNAYIDVAGMSVKLSDLGEIQRRQMGNNIYREDQQYSLYVSYNFTGGYDQASRVLREETKRMNAILPLGFKATSSNSYWNSGEAARQYLLLVLIAVIIYFIGAILFESLLQPLAVILLIPISFIGVFLTFYLTGFRFDQGGFAAFVLLCGIVVNAGFYVISEYNYLSRSSCQRPLQNYLKAYNHKIVPILLTVISTILGLIPFLFEGEGEVFWFSFAIGTMGGMIFNLVALFFFLPLFLSFKEKS
ncbi:MAG: efflux RND transporter permease subunit [Rikenellaceae bacterium]|jgi:multidrug efflux pump subunit AcrB|nr:efflux RND transporter permease subunit [Rikenellaceae bacterium]